MRNLLTETAPLTLGDFDAVLCSNERALALVEEINDNLHEFIERMGTEDPRYDTFFHYWMLLVLAHENLQAVDRKFAAIHEGILAERRKIAA